MDCFGELAEISEQNHRLSEQPRSHIQSNTPRSTCIHGHNHAEIHAPSLQYFLILGIWRSKWPVAGL